jgi:hypothetical protein
LVIVGKDANCFGVGKARQEIDAQLAGAAVPAVLHCIRYPHVEKWLLLDSQAIAAVGGASQGAIALDKCGKRHKEFYKEVLRTCFTVDDAPPAQGGLEFAPQLAEAIDVYRCCVADPSFKRFVDDLRAALRQMRN